MPFGVRGRDTARAMLRRTRRLLLTSRHIWSSSLAEELGFWRDWLATKGADWPGGYALRMDPKRELQSYVGAFLDLTPGSLIRILDVGAGPITSLGRRWEGSHVEVVAIDALAGEYDRLLQEFEVDPPTRTIPGRAEDLLDVVEPESFDVTHAMNSLDHCYDPVLAINQMLAATKPGGLIVLVHHVNEGESRNYSGLHQWNFYLEDGEPMLGGRTGNVALRTEFGAQTSLVRAGILHPDMVLVVLRKRSRP